MGRGERCLMTTALEIITDALRLFGIVDQTENPTATDVANNVRMLNDLLRQELADAACQYTITLVKTVLPQGVNGNVYQFVVGTGSPTYAVQADAVAVRQLWLNDINLTVNRETRMAPKADVVRTTYPGIITKWHQERQGDGSVLVTAWSPPRAPAPALLELGLRQPPITAPDGSDTVILPPEGVHDVKLLLGMTVAGSYGRNIAAADPALAARAAAVDARWRTWARGQQWLRFVRA